MKYAYILGVPIAVAVAGLFIYGQYISPFAQPETVSDYKNTTYLIDGQAVTLVDGLAETNMNGDTTAKRITRFFGNELMVDINDDGVDDVVFVLTQETAGSGVFYYAVGAIKTAEGYVGTDGYLLGDRITPQSTNMSQNARHKNVVVFNYLDRQLSEPMTTQPSVGKSAYLKLVPDTLQWAVVAANPVEEAAANSLLNMIDVLSPEADALVSSPMAVSGLARGYWFFEATAPVVVTNWDGLILGEGYIEAQGDWMTEEFVPFTGEIVYQQEPNTYSATGTLIFKRANPSALPENDAALEIPVQLEDNSL